MAALDPVAARRWCVGIAEMATRREIERYGRPYLDRYELAGYTPGYSGPRIPSLYLHHFLASDPREETHSHPWGWSASLILAGGYREHRCTPDGAETIRELRPGDLNVIHAADRHRVTLLGDECWTLFLAGRYAQPWHFYEAC